MSESRNEHDLDLSVRSAKVAMSVGATTAGDLARFTANELLSAKCFGETSLREIREALARRGLRLGMTLAELQGKPGAQDKIAVRRTPEGSPPTTEPEHEGACCGHCEDAARKLRERVTGDHELNRKLAMSLAELELSVRATNCLEMEGITTVRDLVVRTAEELMELRNFGSTTLKEVAGKLAERGLGLGMTLPVRP